MRRICTRKIKIHFWLFDHGVQLAPSGKKWFSPQPWCDRRWYFRTLLLRPSAPRWLRFKTFGSQEKKLLTNIWSTIFFISKKFKKLKFLKDIVFCCWKGILLIKIFILIPVQRHQQYTSESTLGRHNQRTFTTVWWNVVDYFLNDVFTQWSYLHNRHCDVIFRKYSLNNTIIRTPTLHE